MSKKQVSLPNGCFRSEIKVSPANWNSNKDAIKKEWFIWYRFYDGAKSKLIKIRGMNSIHDLAQRQAETRALKASEIDLIDKQGYNPITGKFMVKDTGNALTMPVTASTLIIEALDFSFGKLEVDPDYLAGIKSTLKYVKKAIVKLGLSFLKISDVRRGHLTLILQECQDNRKLSPTRYNQYRTDLIILFKKLLSYDCIEYNPCEKTEKKKAVKRIRRVPEIGERQLINSALKEANYPFWRFIHIFFHSGARLTELFRVRKEDVNMVKAEYKILLKKGGQYREVLKPIKDIAVPLWEELMAAASPGYYLFSEGLNPGPKEINSNQATRRWNRHVKAEGKLNISADLYSLKHLNLTEMMDELSITSSLENAKKETIELSSHSDNKMLDNVYDIKSSARKSDRIRKVSNKFA